MSALVWSLMLYSAATVTALTATEGIPTIAGEVYAVLVFLSLASHAKTSFTDPGSVPIQAIPVERQRLLRDSHSMCGQCQTFKPPGSHHCRICNRCISRMDHHCPWMNNCVGAGNFKHFILFLIYTWSCATYSLVLFGWNYFFCADEDCTFHPVVLHLVRIMTWLAVGAFLFTSSMLMNVCYGIMTGIGTIDRLKKKATNTMSQSDEEPIDLKDIFGVGQYWTWILPIDPIFDEYDRVMGFTMPQRLDRERQLIEAQPFFLLQQQQQQQEQDQAATTTRTTDIEMPKCVQDFLPV
jgi:palmitoyltransferase ZDHHC3/7/25